MGNVNMDSSQIHYKKSAEYNNVESALTKALQNGSEVSIAQAVTSGTELATVTIDGTGTKIYAPTIPPEKHLEWVTVATGTVNTTNLEQLVELNTVFSTLSENEKNLTRIKVGTYNLFNLQNNIGVFVNNRYGSIGIINITSYIRIDAGNEYYSRCDITSNGVTFTDYLNETGTSTIDLQVLRLVDNV